MIGQFAAALLLASQGLCVTEYPSGHSVRGGFTPDPGLPIFTVHNRRDEPAFVKLESIETGAVHVFFVDRLASVGIDSVLPGDYSVSFAADGRLDSACTLLVQAKSVTRFDQPFRFFRREVPLSDGSTKVEIGDNWIELGAGTDRSAGSTRISIERFNQ